MCKIKEQFLLRLSCSYRKFMSIHRNVLNLKCGKKQQKTTNKTKQGSISVVHGEKQELFYRLAVSYY